MMKPIRMKIAPIIPHIKTLCCKTCDIPREVKIKTKTIKLSTLNDFSRAYAVMYSIPFTSPKTKLTGITKPIPKEIQIESFKPTLKPHINQIKRAAEMIIKSMEKTISQKKVTYDFHRMMEGAELLKTSEFADAMISNM